MTVYFKELNTETELKTAVSETKEAGSAYDLSALLDTVIDSYTYHSKTEGDLAGTLDEDVEITLWYVATIPTPETKNYYYKVITHYTATVNGSTVVNDVIDPEDFVETDQTSVTLDNAGSKSYTSGPYTYTYTLDAARSDVGGATGTADDPAFFNVYYTYSYTTPTPYYPPVTPDPEPDPEPQPEPEPDPEPEIIEEEFEEEETPLAAFPVEEEEEFFDDAVPLAAAPRTADNFGLWVALMMLSGCAVIVTVISKRKADN